jgi:hypothetical protein
MGTVIYILLANYTLTLLVLGLMAAGISLWGRPRPLTAAVVVEDVFAYFLLCSVGVSFFYSFVAHVFFGEMTAHFIGWEPSPFQTEVGMASLGYAAVGLIAFRGDLGLRAAAVLGPAIFYTDLMIHLIGAVLLWLQRRWNREASVPRRGAPAMATPPSVGGHQASPR